MIDDLKNLLLDIGGVWAGLATLAALLAAVWQYYVKPVLLPSPVRSLLGDWWAYGYFYDRDGCHFYREKATFRHLYRWPAHLRLTASPIRNDATAPVRVSYRGRCWYRSAHVFVQCYEPIYDDQTFEIYRRVMDEAHDDNLLVGLHLGKSYDDVVFGSTAMVLSRSRLVEPSDEKSEADTQQLERAEFDRLVGRYVFADQASFQLLVR